MRFLVLASAMLPLARAAVSGETIAGCYITSSHGSQCDCTKHSSECASGQSWYTSCTSDMCAAGATALSITTVTGCYVTSSHGSSCKCGTAAAPISDSDCGSGTVKYDTCTSAMCFSGADAQSHGGGGGGGHGGDDAGNTTDSGGYDLSRPGDLTCESPRIVIAAAGDKLDVSEVAAPLNEPCYADDSCNGYPTCCVKAGTCVSVHGGTISSIARNYEGGCYSDKSRKGAFNEAAGCKTVGECDAWFLEKVQGSTTKNAKEMMAEPTDAILARLKAKDTCGCSAGDVWNEAAKTCDCDPWYVSSSCYRNCVPDPTRCPNFDGKYPPSAPPAPPPPLAMTVSLEISGKAADYDSEQQTEICGKIATAAGVETDAVTCEFEDHGDDDDHSGHAHGRRLQADEGVVVTADIVVPDGKTLQSIGNSLNSAMGTTAKASTLLGVTVTSAPTMTANDGSGAVEPSPSGLSTGAIIGIAVGAVCAVIVVLAAVYVMKKKKGPATNAKGANV